MSLSDIALEPEVVPVHDEVDPYILEMPFPHVPPGPAETEHMGDHVPELLPCSQEIDLVVSAVNVPLPPRLRSFLRSWQREDLNVRVFQGVRRGGPAAQRVCYRETFDMETGVLIAREFFNPVKGQSVRLPTSALPAC